MASDAPNSVRLPDAAAQAEGGDSEFDPTKLTDTSFLQPALAAVARGGYRLAGR